jgi:DNA polymerase-3 subunit beta
MKFIVSQQTLATALNVVSKGIMSNATIPVLAGIRIEAAMGTVEMQTTNLQISVRHAVAANVEEEGVCVVSGRILQNVVKNLSDAPVIFEDRGRVIEITCEKSHFRLNTLEATDFPEFPDVEPARSVELPSELLGRMVDKVYRVTSKDTSRPILSGVLLTVEDNTIRLVATDSYRLAVCDTNTETSGVDEPFEVIVPGTTFHDVLNLPTMTETVSIGITESQLVFFFGATTYISRRIEGNFPNFRALLPKSCTTTVHFDASGLSKALKRVSVIATPTPSVRFDVDADASFMRLSSSSPDQGEAQETVSVEVEGQSVQIALNYHYVLDYASATGQDTDVSLELLGSMQHAVFKSYADINYLYLLMPVRL